ncbi:MAG: carboxypeptidase regulatory-like domain-containing protein [Sphingobacteriales bacterium]|nr:carboxypeptidase regulatory-like domain-containing protein [Sphingobacteriales bacterium]
MNKFSYIIGFCWVLLLGVFLQQPLHAQKSKIKKANKLFERFAYPEAAEMYKKILSKNNDPQVLVNLAECYRYMNEPMEAEYWYEQVMKLPEYDPLHKLYYGMALKMNGKCDIARQVFLEYAQMVPADTRGLRMAESCEKQDYFLQDPGVYKLSTTNVNSGESDFGPAFYQNGIVFASARGAQYKDQIYSWTNAPYLDLYFAEGNENDPAQLSKPDVFKGDANTWMHEGTVTFSKDFKEMYFTRNNFNKGVKGKDKNNTINLKIYSATREGNEWKNIKELPFCSDEYSVGHPTLSADGNDLYFVSDMPGGYGEKDIYVSHRQGDSWTTPENLGPEINTEGREMFPFIHEDGTLYFASDALPGLGGLDVFSSSPQNGIWGMPENLRAPVNTNFDDFGFILNSSKEYGYLASNRAGGNGDKDDDIYSFTRTAFILNGIVVDASTQQPIEGANVKLYQNGILMQEKTTYGNGTFMFPVSSNFEYKVIATKTGYADGEQSVSTVGIEGPSIEVKVPLSPENALAGNKCELRGVVYETSASGQKTPLAGATVKLVNAKDKFEKTAVTDAKGAYFFELDPNSDYVLYVVKEYYFSSNTTLSTVGRDCSSPLTKDMATDISLTKIDIANDGKGDENGAIRYDENGNIIRESGIIPDHILQLNHIYYDLDKSDIRADAAVELNKVVELMYQNPGIVVELGSHTDVRASDAYNMALSQRRAEAAVKYITNKGIKRDRIVARGYGETRLTNECRNGVHCSEQLHQANRRTEFKVIGYSSNAVYSEPRYYGTGYGRDQYNNDILPPVTTNYPPANNNAGGNTAPPDNISESTGGAVSTTTVINNAPSVDGWSYKIQLGAFRKPNYSRFEVLSDLGKIDSERSGDVTKILIGTYYDRNQAENIKNQIKQRGVKDAFVVVYRNGVRAE